MIVKYLFCAQSLHIACHRISLPVHSTVRVMEVLKGVSKDIKKNPETGVFIIQSKKGRIPNPNIFSFQTVDLN